MTTKHAFDLDAFERDPVGHTVQLCTVDMFDIEGELVQHARNYAYAIALAEDLKARAASIKNDIAFRKSREFAALRAEGESIGAADKIAAGSTSVATAQKNHDQVAAQEARLQALVRALDTKTQILIQLAARQRAEINSTRH